MPSSELLSLALATRSWTVSSETLGYLGLAVGVPIILPNLEMLVYWLMHVFAYNLKEYRLSPDDKVDGKSYLDFWKATFDAVNP